TSDTLSHTTLSVCLRPVSPFTKYASGRADRTGCRFVFALIGTRRATDRTAEAWGSCLMTSATTGSGTSGSPLVLVRAIAWLYPATFPPSGSRSACCRPDQVVH